MNRAGIGGRRHGRRAPTSFSLIELLVVMTIIAILMALILAAGIGLLNTGARSRARAEIQAMSSAAESYKIDNGIYPQSDGVLKTNNYTSTDGTSSSYQTNGTLLYIALSGQNNFATVPAAGAKVYMSFKINQVGNPNGTYSYLMDPWTYSYGYSTAQGAAYTPYSGSNFFDLWSTGGLPYTKVNTNTWLRNWAQ
jgi:prepilin-type N-terminal cleavage/methylation domain-containing protein